MSIPITNPSDRAEAARLLRHVRIIGRARGDYVLSVRIWRSRAAIEAGQRWLGCLRKARRSHMPASTFAAEQAARMWDRIGDALAGTCSANLGTRQ